MAMITPEPGLHSTGFLRSIPELNLILPSRPTPAKKVNPEPQYGAVRDAYFYLF